MRHAPRFGVLLALVSVLFITQVAVAQSPRDDSQPPFGEEVEVTEVLLDVLVTDRGGRVILDLGVADFVVEENGETVDLTGVSFYSNRRLIDHDAETSQPADRYFILFFHDQARNGGTLGSALLRRQLEAGRGARDWVQSGMTGGDWVAVVSWDTSLQVHSDFTQNRAQLSMAIDHAIEGRTETNQWPSRREAPAADTPSLLAELPPGKALSDETETMYDALSQVAEATGKLSGRKSLMLFTAGFGEVTPIAVGTRGDPRFYPETKEALNDYNVAVYPLDLVPANLENLQSSFLTQLANDTGGRYWDNVVNYQSPLERIADENSGYYLLSYQSRHPSGESGFQEVDVDTVNPEFRVRARRGYSFGDETD
ncbi:MAG: VWA domain-containing protein [Acidobacteriota bacterium]